MKLFHNPRCSKSRTAMQFLTNRDLEVEVVAYLEVGLSLDEAQLIVQNYKGEFSDLLRNSTHIETNNISKQQKIQLLLEHFEHLQRPLLLTQNDCVIGRPIENFSQIKRLSRYFAVE